MNTNYWFSSGASGGDDDYKIARSLRFNSADDAYLERNISSKNSTYTISFWIKRSKLTEWQYPWSQTDGSGYSGIGFTGDDRISIYNGDHSYTTAVFRDTSAWYHLCLKVSAGIAILYVNNQEVATTPYMFFGGGTSKIGDFITGIHPLNGYLAEFYGIEGQALDPTDFGKYDDNGVWKAKEFEGSFVLSNTTDEVYAWKATTSNANNSGGWYFTQEDGFSSLGLPGATGGHPDELGGNTLGARTGEGDIGVSGTFSTANGNSNRLSMNGAFTQNTSTRSFVYNRTVNKVWVHNGSSWLGGGNPANTSSTPTFFVPSTGKLSFGIIQNTSLEGLTLAPIDSSIYSGTATEITFRGSYNNTTLSSDKTNAICSGGGYSDAWSIELLDNSTGSESFYLDFSDNSSSAALGTDSSGNGNNWTVNNLKAVLAPTQGYKGGDSYVYAGGNSGGAGGGGAGGPGSNSVSGVSAGAGGAGRQSSISGVATYYGGGGGGGSWGTLGGPGGTGGGGDGKLGGSSTGPVNPGTDGLGGGGGGAGYANADWQAGGDGGSGRVIIRYPSSHGALTASNSGSQTTVGSDYVYQWTTVGSGSITFPGSSDISVQFFVLGGGGGAEAGGGGGGGVLEGTISVTGGSSHTITVGDGGTGAAPYPAPGAASNGGNSVFSTYTAIGGGRGGGGDSGAAPTSGGAGGGGGAIPGSITGAAGTGDSPSELDSMIDTPTNYEAGSGNNGGNYATLNLLDKNSNATLTNGNLDYDKTGASGYGLVKSTIAVSSGKWYCEYTLTGNDNTAGQTVGVTFASHSVGDSNYLQSIAGGFGYYSLNGNLYTSTGNSSYGSSFDVGDTIGIVLDMDNGKLFFSKNGVFQNSGNPISGTNPAASGLSGDYVFGVHSGTPGTTAPAGSFNFGQRPFEYTPPTGFKSVCTTNLPDPTITDGSTAFDATLWTGNGTSQTITGLGFSPDFLWVKNRTSATSNYVTDTVRGITKYLITEQTSQEGTNSTRITAVTSDGFSVGTHNGFNDNNKAYVGWTWDAGTSTVTNNDGSIESQVRANSTAGFSVVSYKGSGSNATVGHGLNAAPSMIIVKNRNTTNNWRVGHDGLTDWRYRINLESSVEEVAQSNVWNSTAPTSSFFNIGTSTSVNDNTDPYIAYCFAPVEGYSAFGSYTGNGSIDGTFVYTGFRPAFLLLKDIEQGGGSWIMYDFKRNPSNLTNEALLSDSDAAEVTFTSAVADMLSNGFKLRGTDSWTNTSNRRYIYAAFAEHPFKTARAR